MLLHSSLILALAAMPMVSAQLHLLAKAAGLKYFGTATDNGELIDAQYRKILSNTDDFGQVTASNQMKWMYIEPEYGVFNFTGGQQIIDLAKENRQISRCHALVWHNQLPKWVETSTWGKENLTRALTEHVTAEVTQWKGKCYAWDVVNEGLADNGTYRPSLFYNVLGEDYIKIAFKAAAKADPKAKLYYNDYAIETIGNKSNGARNIVKMLQKANIKIDGVGLQSHFTVGRAPTMDSQIANMRAFTALGVEVAQTELDVRILLPTNATNLALQSEVYKNSTGACVQVDGCIGITVWDFYDPFSWVPGVFAGYGAATLWFENYTKHPAYYGIVDALKNATKPHHPHHW